MTELRLNSDRPVSSACIHLNRKRLQLLRRFPTIALIFERNGSARSAICGALYSRHLPPSSAAPPDIRSVSPTAHRAAHVIAAPQSILGLAFQRLFQDQPRRQRTSSDPNSLVSCVPSISTVSFSRVRSDARILPAGCSFVGRPSANSAVGDSPSDHGAPHPNFQKS